MYTYSWSYAKDLTIKNCPTNPYHNVHAKIPLRKIYLLGLICHAKSSIVSEAFTVKHKRPEFRDIYFVAFAECFFMEPAKLYLSTAPSEARVLREWCSRPILTTLRVLLVVVAIADALICGRIAHRPILCTAAVRQARSAEKAFRLCNDKTYLWRTRIYFFEATTVLRWLVGISIECT